MEGKGNTTENSPIDLNNSLNKIENYRLYFSHSQTLNADSEFQTLQISEFKVKAQGKVFAFYRH